MSEIRMYYSFILRAEVAKLKRFGAIFYSKKSKNFFLFEILFFFEEVLKVLTDQTLTTRPKLEYPKTIVFIDIACNFLEQSLIFCCHITV